jgi:hypothetical protein
MKKSIVLTITATVVIVAAAIIAIVLVLRNPEGDIQSFEDCVAKGYPVQETFPERCVTPSGKTFVKQVGAQQTTVTGLVVCLPHKIKDGPQTTECAFGIKDDNGNHYGISDPEMKYIFSLPTGIRVTITGTFTPDNNDRKNQYDTVGTIEVTDLKRL